MVIWFKVYSGGLLGLSAMLLLLGVALMTGMLDFVPHRDPEVYFAAGLFYAAAGLASTVVHVIPFVVGRKPWVWVYNLVIMCISACTCCTAAMAIPLIIYWIKPETQAYYGRD